jgi:hypothetical protein
LLHVAYGYRGGAVAIAINTRGAASTSIRAARVKSANSLPKLAAPPKILRRSSPINPRTFPLKMGRAIR